MPIQQEINLFVSILGRDLVKEEIFFEAHFWGTFKLVQGFGAKDNTFAISQFSPLDQRIFFDSQTESFVLERSGELPISIAFSPWEFFHSPEHFEQKIKRRELHFDHRNTFQKLLPVTSFLISPFNDPEHFEELEAYFRLIKLVNELTGVSIEVVNGEQDGDRKNILIRFGSQQRTIELHKELFDQEIILQINHFFEELGLKDFSLAVSINEEMHMVLLKLNKTQKQELSRMGLLI